VSSVVFTPVETGSLAARIQERLESAIYSGELQPGQHLLEIELAEAFRVSRASLREALRLLENKGLVVSVPRRGTFVAELTERDVRDIYTLRVLLEGHAIRHIATRPEPALLDRLDALVADLGERARKGDHMGIVDLDVEVHRTICVAAGNKKLLDVWESLVAPVRALLLVKYRISDDSAEIERGHLQLVEAIRAENPDRAEALLKSHIIDTAELVLQLLDRDQAEPTARVGVDDGTSA
jgi:DNA-binding GntR family transcriptional regulator